MTGVLFIVCVPRAEYERALQKSQIADCNLRRRESENVKSAQRSRSTETLGGSRSKDAEINVAKFKSDADISNAGLQSNKSSEKSVFGEEKILFAPEINEQKIPFSSATPLEKILNELLERLHVKDAVWCLGKEKKYYQVFFSIEAGEVCEEALQLLASFGIGTKYNSAVSVIPCTLYFRAVAPKDQAPVDEGSHNNPATSAWSKFISSVRSRTTLAQLLQDVRADATLTFDWLFLLLVAAFVSAIGLVEDSTVFLVASMLISPLMGPIMACAVGTAVRDISLQRMGLLHELFGLFLALVIGFFFGLAICIMGDSYGDEPWPTLEMMSRCEVRSLWVGVLVTLPSAAAVAIAVLGGYTASLVGVAISASLLPPAVNAGLLWAKALTTMIYTNSTHRWDLGNVTFYSNNLSVEIAAHGGVSLCLTVVNILCIYIGCVIVYKIKEVAPIDPKNMRFWKTTKRDSTGKEECVLTPRGSTNSVRPALRTWEYMSWCRKSDGVMLPRMTEYDRQHDTWSPYTASSANAPPLIRDIEAYWKQAQFPNVMTRARLGKTASEILTSPGYSRLPPEYISVDMNVDPGPSCSSDNLLNGEPGTKKNTKNADTRKAKKGKTKFTVTPCSIDSVN